MPITGAEGSGIGTGSQNTQDILNACFKSGIAADKCGDLEVAGYTGWFLPSIDELESMRANLYDLGLGEFNTIPAAEYWSSTLNPDTRSAYAHRFPVSWTFNRGIKFTENFVRAVRSFDF